MRWFIMQALIENAYNKLKLNNDGKVADYIPQLANVEPNKFAIMLLGKRINFLL